MLMVCLTEKENCYWLAAIDSDNWQGLVTFCCDRHFALERESYWWRYEHDVGGWDCFPFISLCCSTLAFSHIFIFFYAFLSQLSHVVGLMSSLPLYYIYLVLSDFGPLGCQSSIYSTNHFNFQGINQWNWWAWNPPITGTHSVPCLHGCLYQSNKL